MALLFMDGFDKYAASADLVKEWNNNSMPSAVTFNPTAGRFGGGAVVAAPTTAIYANNYGLQKIIRPVGNPVVRVGMSFKATAKPADTYGPWFMALLDSTNPSSNNSTAGASLGCSTVTGAIGYRPWTGGSITNPTGSGSINVCDGNWHWIEIHFRQTPSGGVFQVRVDGVVDVDTPGYLGPSPAVDRITLQPFYGGGTITFDDIVFFDDEDSGITGDLVAASYPLGDRKISTIRPNGAGSSATFTPSAGSNFQCVDEITPNADTDYVSTLANASKDLYAFGDLPGTPSIITAVVLKTSARNADVGAIQIAGKVKSGGVEATGATKVAPAASYNMLQWNLPRDPNTSAPWTYANLNAAEFGFSSTLP